MAEPRSVVITGASRGLGFASAVRLYREGWRVVAAMRTPDRGMPLLREATGASEDDDRLIGVQLDLMDAASIAAAAKAIEEAVGAPYALVHNAGISAAGMVEETDMALWQNMFATSVMGPVALTQALLPSMRAAGEGRIVLVSSAAGVRGQPATAPYSAAKGALERWGESMAVRDRAVRSGCHRFGGRHLRHRHHHRRGHHRRSQFRRSLRPAAQHHEHPGPVRDETCPTARTVHRRIDQGAERPGSFRRRGVGPDASMLLVSNRILPASGMHHMSRIVLGIPRQGSMRGGAWPLTAAQKAMVFVAKRASAAGVAALGIAGGEAPPKK